MKSLIKVKTWVNDKNDLKFKTTTPLKLDKFQQKKLRAFLYKVLLTKPPGEERCIGKDGEPRYYWDIVISTHVIFKVCNIQNHKLNDHRAKKYSPKRNRTFRRTSRTENKK